MDGNREWSSGADEHLSANVENQYNMDTNGQNGQNEHNSNGESELYKQILVSAWNRDGIYDDETLGRMIAGANADGVIEHVDRIKAACVGPFNRERGGHVGIEIYAECKDDYLRLLFNGLDVDGRWSIKLFPKVQRRVKNVYNIQISGLPLAIDEEEVRQMAQAHFRTHKFEILEVKRGTINVGGGLHIPSNRYNLKVRMLNVGDKIHRDGYERTARYWADSVQRFFVQQNLTATMPDIPPPVPVSQRVFTRRDGQPVISSGAEDFADESRAEGSVEQQPQPQQTKQPQPQTQQHATQELTQTPYPETQPENEPAQLTQETTSQDLTLTTTQPTQEESKITTTTTTTTTSTTEPQITHSQAATPTWATKVKDGPGRKNNLKMVDGRTRLTPKKGRTGIKRGSETRLSDQEQRVAKRGEGSVESDNESNEGMAVDEPEGREDFIRRFMTGKFQCPDDVFKYEAKLDDGEKERRMLVLQLADERTQRQLPEYLKEHEKNIWAADLTIYTRVAALVEDVVGVYEELKETDELFIKDVILGTLHEKVGDAWKRGDKDENFMELLTYYNEHVGRVRNDEG